MSNSQVKRRFRGVRKRRRRVSQRRLIIAEHIVEHFAVRRGDDAHAHGLDHRNVARVPHRVLQVKVDGNHLRSDLRRTATGPIVAAIAAAKKCPVLSEGALLALADSVVALVALLCGARSAGLPNRNHPESVRRQILGAQDMYIAAKLVDLLAFNEVAMAVREDRWGVAALGADPEDVIEPRFAQLVRVRRLLHDPVVGVDAIERHLRVASVDH